jgi:hypothetical protein
MLMPKTAVYKEDFFSTNKNKIWFSGQVFPVQAVTVSTAVHKPPHEHFRLHILAPDRLHVLAAAPWRDRVHNAKC